MNKQDIQKNFDKLVARAVKGGQNPINAANHLTEIMNSNQTDAMKLLDLKYYGFKA